MQNISEVNKVHCPLESPRYYDACSNELTPAAVLDISTGVERRCEPSPDQSVTAADGLHIRPPSGVRPDVGPLRYGSATEQLSLISFLFPYRVPASADGCWAGLCCLEVAIVMRISLVNCENEHLSECNIQSGRGCKQTVSRCDWSVFIALFT